MSQQFDTDRISAQGIFLPGQGIAAQQNRDPLAKTHKDIDFRPRIASSVKALAVARARGEFLLEQDMLNGQNGASSQPSGSAVMIEWTPEPETRLMAPATWFGSVQHLDQVIEDAFHSPMFRRLALAAGFMIGSLLGVLVGLLPLAQVHAESVYTPSASPSPYVQSAPQYADPSPQATQPTRVTLTPLTPGPSAVGSASSGQPVQGKRTEDGVSMLAYSNYNYTVTPASDLKGNQTPSLRMSPSYPQLEPLYPTNAGGQTTSVQELQTADPMLEETQIKVFTNPAYAGSPAVIAPVTAPGAVPPAYQYRTDVASHSAMKAPAQPKVETRIVDQPVPSVLIVPVMRHGPEKAYHDLPLLFANEWSHQFAQKYPDTTVINPGHFLDELQVRGLSSLYKRMVRTFIATGRPDRNVMSIMLDEMAPPNKPIMRVVFVEANLSAAEPGTPQTWMEKFKQWTTDSAPKTWHMVIDSRIRVFDTSNTQYTRLWDEHSDKPINVDQLITVQPSVFDTGDSAAVFTMAAKDMSKGMLLLAPKRLHVYEETATFVEGRLVRPGEALGPADGQYGEPSPRLGPQSHTTPMDASDRQAIRNVLARSR